MLGTLYVNSSFDCWSSTLEILAAMYVQHYPFFTFFLPSLHFIILHGWFCIHVPQGDVYWYLKMLIVYVNNIKLQDWMTDIGRRQSEAELEHCLSRNKMCWQLISDSVTLTVRWRSLSGPRHCSCMVGHGRFKRWSVRIHACVCLLYVWFNNGETVIVKNI